MKRPYFFEVFIVANFVLLQALLWRIADQPLTTLAKMFAVLLPVFVVQLLIGMAIRFAIRRGEYTRAIRSRTWLIDTVRLIVFNVLSVQTYGWIKLSVPLLHHRLFDPQLRAISRWLFFDHNPNVFFLELFSNPSLMRAFDWSYANVFIASINIASIYFLSDPDDRIRIGFMNANTLMWIAGAWIYLAVPSLGPAYFFPQIYLPLAPLLANTQQLQRILMHNYQNIFRAGAPVNVFFGVAAFPSLHVAFEVLVFLWLRKLWRVGAAIFAVFAIVIFLGSLVTGWHYLIDAIAGVALALLAYAAVAIWQRSRTFSDRNATAD